jgi:hypothetical protein
MNWKLEPPLKPNDGQITRQMHRVIDLDAFIDTLKRSNQKEPVLRIPTLHDLDDIGRSNIANSSMSNDRISDAQIATRADGERGQGK